MARKVHFIGIGGVGMAGLARLVKARGDDVSGCAIDMTRAATRARVIVLSQPHRYSRTRALLNDFPAAFVQADEVVLLLGGGDINVLAATVRADLDGVRTPCQ